MTTLDELRELIRAHGLDQPRYGWQLRLASKTGRSIHTVRKWAASTSQPDKAVIALLRELLKLEARK